MATEIAHEPVSARKPLSLDEGTDAISGILSREEPEESLESQEAAPETVEDDSAEVEAAEVVEEPERDEPVEEVEAKEAPAKEESEETTSEVELEPAQVAQILGLEDDAIDVDDDGNVRIHTKVDGKPAQVALKDLRHSYELAATHEERLRQLGRERKAFQDESKAALEQLAQQHNRFNESVQAIEAEYASDFQSVDWNRLREEDPTEYNAKRLDYEDRRQRIERYKAHSREQYESLQQQAQHKMAEMQAEGAKTLAEVFEGESYAGSPKWDEEESQRLAKWIMDQGFTTQDIGQVAVWQVFKWARDSMLREEERKIAKETVKKVTKVAKVSKPGTSKPPAETAKAKTRELKSKQRKSGGGLKETTDLITSLLDRGK